MGCDMVVALPGTTGNGFSLFGHNCGLPSPGGLSLRREPGRSFAADEKACLQHLQIPHARQTYTVLAGQPHGCAGYAHGVNDQGVAIGCAALRTRIICSRTGLAGTDLVRLILERCRSARQGVDLLTELVERYGQGSANDDSDAQSAHAFLVADATEAFLVETASEHWVLQEIREVRATSNLCTIQQDWNRISRGLADFAIGQGWWPGDGSKVNVARAVAEDPHGEESALQRWGRSTLLLEQQNGRVDAAFLRRVLSDHYEGTNNEVDPQESSAEPVPLCRHDASATAASFVTELGNLPNRLPIAWFAYGPPCVGLYFPIFLDGELPALLSGAAPSLLGNSHSEEGVQAEALRETLGSLQTRFDQEAEEFATEGASLKASGADLQRQASLFMQHLAEEYEKAMSPSRSKSLSWVAP